MTKLYRSARGQMVDFELLAIKQQLAMRPVPRHVETRKIAIDAKDGIKTDVKSDLDFMTLAREAAQRAAAAAIVAESESEPESTTTEMTSDQTAPRVKPRRGSQLDNK